MTQVLIAVDESEQSLNAARVAYDLFGDSATYTVVNVADQSPMMWGGDSLMWGVGYPVLMAPSGLVGVGPVPNSVPTASASEVDSAPLDAAMQVALDVATEADLPNPQVVGEVGDPALWRSSKLLATTRPTSSSSDPTIGTGSPGCSFHRSPGQSSKTPRSRY